MRITRLLTLVLAIMFVAGISTRVMAEDAADVYKAKCQSCHGADGKGATPIGPKLGVRDFHAPEVAKESDQEMFDITKNGKAKMPKYDGKLTDDQIKDLVKFIRGLK
ncbi:MAG TPA: cytochrome c [Candidatus Angelobacter sp.]|nr:cytochrome c [Candidatus Angelobacter sp.]